MRKVGNTSEFPFGIYWWTLKNLKDQTFEKMKKIAGDIILHMCTKNHKHMRYSSRGTECDRIFVILGHFCPFNPSPLKTRKPKLWKNEYSIWRSHHFKLSNKKHDHVMYAYSDMECNGYNFLSFQAIFALLQKLTPPPYPPPIDPEK